MPHTAMCIMPGRDGNDLGECHARVYTTEVGRDENNS